MAVGAQRLLAGSRRKHRVIDDRRRKKSDNDRDSGSDGLAITILEFFEGGSGEDGRKWSPRQELEYKQAQRGRFWI